MAIKESLIQTAIEQYLKYQENLGKLIYIKNNTGAFQTQGGGFYRMGKAGSPDFFIFYGNGGVLHLEVKNEKGKLNKNQEAYKKDIEKLGHNYLIVRSVDEAEASIKSLST